MQKKPVIVHITNPEEHECERCGQYANVDHKCNHGRSIIRGIANSYVLHVNDNDFVCPNCDEHMKCPCTNDE